MEATDIDILPRGAERVRAHWPAAWRQGGDRAHSAEVLDFSEQGAFLANGAKHAAPEESRPVELILYVGIEQYRIECNIVWVGLSPHHHAHGFGVSFDPADAYLCEALAYQLLVESGGLD